MKNSMLLAAAAAAAATGATLGAPLVSFAQDSAGRPPSISVSAEGKRTVTPDRASVFLAIENRARTPASAGAENARIAGAIRAAVMALGVPREQISTQRYNVRADVQIIHGEMGREVRRDSAFIATNSVRVELRNLDLLGRVIDTALTAGATSVASVSYWLADMSAARREASTEAVRSARSQAEALATAAGGSLGDLMELTTEPMRIFGQEPVFGEVMLARMAADVTTPVSPRDIDVTAFVTARWKFVPRAR